MTMTSGHIPWTSLFPTRVSPYVFVSYIALFVAQGIFVTASQTEGSAYAYNTVTVVLLTEVVKLVVSLALYLRTHSLAALFREMEHALAILALYLVPAALYCVYNNLAFVNLSAFDPTTYYLLLQFRVVLTGLAFQALFCQRLSGRQWLSLVLLTAGCMIKQMDPSHHPPASTSPRGLLPWGLSLNHGLVLLQTLCSCVAGVSNEKILKTAGARVDIFVHNIFMCAESIACNVAVLLLVKGSLDPRDAFGDVASLCTWRVAMVMVTNAAIGIVTSLFLKHLSAILKAFASALELVFTPLCCWLVFGIPVYANTVVAVAVVTLAVYLYSQNPVVTPRKRPPWEETPLGPSTPAPLNDKDSNYLISLRIV